MGGVNVAAHGMKVGADFDRSTPLLLVKVGYYPQHHGGLALARSMGGVGVPVLAMVENRLTPLATSRYVRWRAPALHSEAGEIDLVRALARVHRHLGVRPVAAATDDEAGVLLDEHRDRISQFVVLPQQRLGLARRVSSKAGLAEICLDRGINTPATCAPKSAEELTHWAQRAMFPVVVKNAETFARVNQPAISATTVMSTRAELDEWMESFDQAGPAVVQEYIPLEHRENLIYNRYRASGSDRIVSFTGVKHRDWPVGSGPATLLESVANPRLQAMCEDLLTSLDYRGACDIDVIHDKRDGQYKMIDFNPRFGASSGMFITDSGIDLVRAYHLDLTGREIPDGSQINGVVYRVEPDDRRARRSGIAPSGPRPTLRAYHHQRDPVPGLMLAARIGASNLRGLVARHSR